MHPQKPAITLYIIDLKYILNEILVTFEKNFKNFRKNFGLIISKI